MAAVAFLVEGASHGTITVIPGNERARATSSIPICEGPSSPIEMPACEPTSLTFMRRKGDRHADLFVGVAQQKTGETGDDGSLAVGRQSSSDADQVAFGNADVESAIGKRVGKDLGAGRIADVSVDGHDFRMECPELLERVAERVARRLAHLQATFFTDRHLDFCLVLFSAL